MKKLVIRADDIGYSEAVNYGIYKAVKDGLIRSAGLMPNMPYAKHGIDLLKEFDIALGQHTNMCLGRPCADPALIPSLLDENGNLKSSRMYREAFQKGEEIITIEEAVIEIEAQYERFKVLLMSKNLFTALSIVAEKYGLPEQKVRFDGQPTTFNNKPVRILPMGSMKPDYDAYQCLKDGVRNVAKEDMPSIAVMHPGYLDAYLLNNSSLTINRTKEVEMLCDPAMRSWLLENDVELVDYRDIR